MAVETLLTSEPVATFEQGNASRSGREPANQVRDTPINKRNKSPGRLAVAFASWRDAGASESRSIAAEVVCRPKKRIRR